MITSMQPLPLITSTYKVEAQIPGNVIWVQTGADADIEKYSKRTVRVTAQHNEECRRLLQLMGVPVIEVCTWPTKFHQFLLIEVAFATCHHPNSASHAGTL